MLDELKLLPFRATASRASPGLRKPGTVHSINSGLTKVAGAICVSVFVLKRMASSPVSLKPFPWTTSLMPPQAGPLAAAARLPRSTQESAIE